jgi:hypothetical protein
MGKIFLNNVKKIFLFLLFFIFIGCSKEDNKNFYEDNKDFYASKYFFELSIDGKVSRANSDSFTGETFDLQCNFSKSNTEINYGFDIFNQSGVQGGVISANTQLSKITSVLSIIPLEAYLTDGQYKNCTNNVSSIITVPMNITKNDNKVGGVIEGNFNGLVAMSSLGVLEPCNNCCYNFVPFSGKFRLKIEK